MPNKRKKTAGRRAAAKKEQRLLVGAEVVAIFLIAVTIFLAVSLYFQAGGIIGDACANALKGLFGSVAYLLPPILLCVLVHAMVKTEQRGKGIKYILVLLLILDLAALCTLLLGSRSTDGTFWSYYYFEGLHAVSGGVFGAMLAIPLESLLGLAGADIFFVALLLILLICIFEISIIKVGAAVGRGFGRLFGMIGSDIQELKQIRAEEKKQQAAKKQEKRQEKEIVLHYDEKAANKEPEIVPEPEPYVEPEIKVYGGNGQMGLAEVLGDEPDEELDAEEQMKRELDTATEESGQMPYVYPGVELLSRPQGMPEGETVEKELKQNAKKLTETLKSFHVDGKVVEISRGPTVTRYEVKPAAGVKVNQITGLANDIALNLAAKGVMVAPIPGKPTIGIELANKNPSMVTLREVLESEEFLNHPSKLAVALGKDISGRPIIMDLAKMPHLLVAGATGAGKSVCINTLVISLLYKADPNEVKLVMVDPKQVELGVYNGIPHLLIPVVKDAKKAAGALSWAVTEMTERYSEFERHNVRNIQGYNELMEANGEKEKKMPQIVIIIDEFADLMMVAPGDVENYVCRIAQLARAAGMHLVIATQRPVVKFITGNIKANIPSRISFMVASVRDSQTILDMGGAEKLIGKGDMLYMPVGETKPMRMQCAFVSDAEVKRVVDAVSQNGGAAYNEDVLEQIEKEEVYNPDGDDPGDCDEFLPEAVEMAIVSGQISTSLLQRRFKIGYNRAGRIIDQMEQRGIISGLDGNKPRQVLISRDEYNEMLMNSNFRAGGGDE